MPCVQGHMSDPAADPDHDPDLFRVQIGTHGIQSVSSIVKLHI